MNKLSYASVCVTCSDIVGTTGEYVSLETYSSGLEITTIPRQCKTELFQVSTGKVTSKLFTSSKSSDRKKSIRELNKKVSRWK